MNRQRFISLNPEILAEAFRKRSEFSEDIKKGKDIPNETLLKMLLTKLNEATEQESKKEKKRDNTKSTKTVAVEDYPPDGPDLYYILHDIPRSFNDIQALKDHSVTLDLILNLKTSNSGSSFAEELKGITEKRSEAALMDCIVKDIEVGNRDAKDVAEEIVQQCYHVVSLRHTFLEWNRKVSLVKLPSPSNFWGSSQGTGYKLYDDFIQSVPETAVSVPLIVHGILNQVIGKSPRSDDPPPQPDLPSYFHKAFSKLTGASITPQNDQAPPTPLEPSISLCSEYDSTAIRSFGIATEGGTLDALERNLLYCVNTPGEHPLASSDENLEQIEEALIERRKFYTYAKQFTPHQIDYTFLVFEFEDMINEYLEDKVKDQRKREQEDKHKKLVEQAKAQGTFLKKQQDQDTEDDEILPEIYFSDRCFVEELSKGAITHILQNLSGDGHTVLQQYYPLLDCYLVAFLTEVPPERITPMRTVEGKVPSKTCFGKWLSYHAKQDNENASHGAVYDITEEQGSTTFNSSTMYPHDGSFIHLSQWTAGSSKEHRVLLHHSSSIFGLSTRWDADKKSSSCFGAQLPENILLSALNDTDSQVNVALPQGLNLTYTFKDGSLTQFYKGFHDTTTKPNPSKPEHQARAVIGGSPLVELNRTISKSGVLVRFMEDGTKEVIHPDGKTELVKSYGDRIITLPHGKRHRITADGNEIHLPSIGVARKTDPETNKVDITREDMVFATQYPDGSTSLHIPDGTIITTKGQYVTIQSPSYATVQVSPDNIQLTLDGATLMCNPQHVVLSSQLGPCVDIRSSGSVQVHPDSTKKGGQADVDWLKGTFQYTDIKGAIFSVLSDGTSSVQLKQEEPSRATESQEVDSEAEEDENDEEPSPIIQAMASHPPRLFVRRPDGTACELLRADDIMGYLNNHKSIAEKETSRVWYRCEPLEEGSQCFTVVKKARQVQGSVLMTYRQIYQHNFLSSEDQQILTDIFTAFQNQEENGSTSQDDIAERTEEELAQEKAVMERIAAYQKSKDNTVKDKEAQLLKDYIQICQAPQEQGQAVPKTKPVETKKWPLKKARFDTEKVKQQLDTIKQELTPVTPNYFETEEGIAFLQTNSSPAKKPSSIVTPARPSQSPPDSPPLSPSQRVTSSPRAQTSSSAKTTQGSTTPKKKVDVAQNRTPSRGERINSPIKTDVHGNQRKSPPQIPKTHHLQTGTPNTKYLDMESSVKRKLHTSSLKNGMSNQLFAISPAALDFGTLQQGITYKATYTLTNTGVDMGRYLVKGPPHKDIYCSYIAGPVAPGMTVRLDVQLKANEIGSLSQELKVETPAEVFRIPITAIVLPPDQTASPSKGVVKL